MLKITLNCIFSCYFCQAGKILLLSNDWKSRTIKWTLWGISLVSGLCNTKIIIHKVCIMLNDTTRKKEIIVDSIPVT